MSKKTDLIMALQDYKKKYEPIKQQIDKIYSGAEYTEEGKRQELQKILTSFGPVVKEYHDKAAELIDVAVGAVGDIQKAECLKRLADGGYQAGLANVIKMLELGAVGNVEDFKNILEVYTDDPNAMAMIKELINKSGNESLMQCMSGLSIDVREDSRRLLGQLRGNIDKYVSLKVLRNPVKKSWNSFNGADLGNVSASLDSMIRFVDERLNDNLEIIE